MATELQQMIDVVAKDNLLTVKDKGPEADDAVYLHRGIGRRAFEHRFQLTDYVRVTGASLANGLLDIQLVREVPEAMKPQQIKINAAPKPRVIENKKSQAA